MLNQILYQKNERKNTVEQDLQTSLSLPNPNSISNKLNPFSNFELPGNFNLIRKNGPNFSSETYQDKRNPKIKFAHGTTTLAFKFKDGVIVAVDSRASMGSFVSSNNVRKILPIHDFMSATMAGGAADCSYQIRVLKAQIRVRELRNGEPVSVCAASKLFSNIMQSYRGYGLSLGSMIAGYDAFGPQLYYVDNDGNRIKHEVFSVGSGSLFAYGILDTEFKKDMALEEAVELGRKAIYHATHRDSGSGGIIRVLQITKEGSKFAWTGDMNELHKLYANKKLGKCSNDIEMGLDESLGSVSQSKQSLPIQTK